VAVGTDLTQDGQAARSHNLSRNVTSNTAGNNLTVQAGGATIGATDKDGGKLILAPGLSTGTAKSSVRIQRNMRAVNTGTGDNTLIDGYILPSVVTLNAEGSVNLFEIALPASTMAGGFITYQITATNNTDFQTYAGTVNYGAVNKGGVYSTDIQPSAPTPAVYDVSTGSTGLITPTWAITSGTNKVTISVSIDCSSITASDIRIYYTIHNGSNRAITQL
jgi:hypothetical protein